MLPLLLFLSLLLLHLCLQLGCICLLFFMFMQLQRTVSNNMALPLFSMHMVHLLLWQQQACCRAAYAQKKLTAHLTICNMTLVSSKQLPNPVHWRCKHPDCRHVERTLLVLRGLGNFQHKQQIFFVLYHSNQRIKVASWLNEGHLQTSQSAAVVCSWPAAVADVQS